MKGGKVGYKTRRVYTTGKNNDECKCFSGDKCANYTKKCRLCYKIQGKYTKFLSKVEPDCN